MDDGLACYNVLEWVRWVHFSEITQMKRELLDTKQHLIVLRGCKEPSSHSNRSLEHGETWGRF